MVMDLMKNYLQIQSGFLQDNLFFSFVFEHFYFQIGYFRQYWLRAHELVLIF